LKSIECLEYLPIINFMKKMRHGMVLKGVPKSKINTIKLFFIILIYRKIHVKIMGIWASVVCVKP
jgi:hypothetical protein